LSSTDEATTEAAASCPGDALRESIVDALREAPR
jgi:hypothetical protein